MNSKTPEYLEWLITGVNSEIHERIDDLEMETASRFWFYGPNPFGGLRMNVLPWLGSDGNNTWCRQTLVIPFFGLGALIIGLRWHLSEECETNGE
ncbi:hypothetical protein [Gordonia sp. (in: high G+C Gram-positive bacteria)]|uniref:hypothetical protein n=1 Tax=Gordonia sp. (in: high G+C Gram-positive bacteria) TaxID=84139 RepID=UPI00333F5A1F